MDYVSSGKLVSSGGFVHPRRNLDTFVFILIREGVLHISQGMNHYDVKENEYIILFPGVTHYGYKPSEGALSYYWTHFHITDPDYTIYSRGSVLRSLETLRAEHAGEGQAPDIFFLQEYGQAAGEYRLALLFKQLLDTAKRGNYYASWTCHYSLSMMMMELTTETFAKVQSETAGVPSVILKVMEWIRINSDQPLLVHEIADRFNYHPAYLAGLFKKSTGYSMISFINRTKIERAKNLLADGANSIKYIADKIGFQDEKYFMRMFKKMEGITPSEYRRAFLQQKREDN